MEALGDTPEESTVRDSTLLLPVGRYIEKEKKNLPIETEEQGYRLAGLIVGDSINSWQPFQVRSK